MLTPMKAIRAKCLDCCCGNQKEVELCPCEDCSLHDYRFGHKPYAVKQPASEAKMAALRKAWAARGLEKTM